MIDTNNKDCIIKIKYVFNKLVYDFFLNKKDQTKLSKIWYYSPGHIEQIV